jgi:hypothetical protein
MRLPPKTLSKYLGRLDELIAEGERVPIRNVSVVSGGNYLSGETYYKQEREVDLSAFIEWRTKSQTLLDQIIPKQSVHRATVETFNKLKNTPNSLQSGVSFLKSIRDDLQTGFLDSLASEIESEVAADLLGQAARLFEETPQEITHVAAAVLAGAVLEKGLRSLCEQLTPPEPTNGAAGQPLTMNPLIDALKRRGLLNEVSASQLRAWAAIRNSAAHGRTDQFTREQAHAMMSGVITFLAQHL